MGTFLKRFTIPKTDWIFTSGKREEIFLEKKYKLNPDRTSIVRSPINISVYKPCVVKMLVWLQAWIVIKDTFYLLADLDDSVKRVSSIIAAFQQVAAKFA